MTEHPEQAALALGDLIDVILLVKGGSFAHGLATEGSDRDFRGVYVAPAERVWSVTSPPQETIERKEPDTVVHELRKFCALALKGNPSVLETLWAEGGYLTGAGMELRALRKAFLWKGSLQPYIGYAKSQLWRLHHTGRPQNQGKEGADGKFAMHLHRILLAGIHLAMTGEVLVDVSKPADPNFGDHKEYLLEVRGGKNHGWSIDRMTARATTYLSSLESWAEKANLPDAPDIEAVESYVRSVRRAGIP